MKLERIKTYAEHGYDMIVVAFIGNVTQFTFVRRAPGIGPSRLRIFIPKIANMQTLFAELNTLSGWDVRFANNGFQVFKLSADLHLPHPHLQARKLTQMPVVETSIATCDTIPPETLPSATDPMPAPVHGPVYRGRRTIGMPTTATAPKAPKVP